MTAQPHQGFPAKLGLVLKALTMSRGRLALELGVDKSLVGRWVSGAYTPSTHNLSRLTALIAEKRPGFNMLDWEREPAEIAGLFGAELPGAPEPPADGGLTLPALERGRSATLRRGAAYAGFWRSTRASTAPPLAFWHEYWMIRPAADGLLDCDIGSAGMVFRGRFFLYSEHVYAIVSDLDDDTPYFFIAHGVSLPRAEALEGLIIGVSKDAMRGVVAFPILVERIGDLTGDLGEDERRLRRLQEGPAIADEARLPEEVRRHLLPDVGPSHLAEGGHWMLRRIAAESLSRGGEPRLARTPPELGGLHS
jgi:hypothetical protein